MSCEECEKSQEGLDEVNVYYYRWKNANIAVIGCRKHVKEMFDYLNKR